MKPAHGGNFTTLNLAWSVPYIGPERDVSSGTGNIPPDTELTVSMKPVSGFSGSKWCEVGYCCGLTHHARLCWSSKLRLSPYRCNGTDLAQLVTLYEPQVIRQILRFCLAYRFDLAFL